MDNEHHENEIAVGCIVGAVVQFQQDGDAARRQLAQCRGVDIHVEDEQLRVVITIEAATSMELLKLTEQIQNIDGVLHVSPVYHYCEEDHQHEQQGGWKWR